VARRKVKATLDDFGRAVLIVYEAFDRADEVCYWPTRASLFEAAESLRGVTIKVSNAERKPTP